MNPFAILILIRAYPTIPLSGQSYLVRLYLKGSFSGSYSVYSINHEIHPYSGMMVQSVPSFSTPGRTATLRRQVQAFNRNFVFRDTLFSLREIYFSYVKLC
jgi:hypothetical protein